jgi:hypothetical protein
MPISAKPIDVESMQSILAYDAVTGDLLWRHDRSSHRAKAGSIAGSRKFDSLTGRPKSIELCINKVMYQAHRIVWAIVTGVDAPSHLQIDHENRDPFDNRIGNLRLATPAQNNANRIYRNRKRALPKGVYQPRGSRRFFANIEAGGRRRFLGSFATAEEAHSAYMAAAVPLYGKFIRAAA